MTTIFDGSFWMHSKEEFGEHVQKAISGLRANEMPANCGIYIMANSKNGFVYVGRSVNMLKRAKLHIASMESGVHINRKLVDACKEYGRDAFRFHAMWACEPKDAWLLEKGAMFRMDIDKTYNLQNLYCADSSFYRKIDGRKYYQDKCPKAGRLQGKEQKSR